MIRIGKIAATHGIQGAMILTHIADSPEWLKQGNTLFIELSKDSLIPFTVETLSVTGKKEYRVRLEDISTVEEARRLTGRHVYADPGLLEGHIHESPLLWIGFEVRDKKLGSLGPLLDVIQAGPQWLGKVLNRHGKEMLFPIVPEFIGDINPRKKTISTSLPEGLAEI